MLTEDQKVEALYDFVLDHILRHRLGASEHSFGNVQIRVGRPIAGREVEDVPPA